MVESPPQTSLNAHKTKAITSYADHVSPSIQGSGKSSTDDFNRSD